MKPRCDTLSKLSRCHIMFPKVETIRQTGNAAVHSTNDQGYSVNSVTVLLYSAPNPPALAIALFNSLVVRCPGLSRRSRAIPWRSSPYFLTRRSRYDLSPKEVCRSRTIAEVTRFSKSMGPLVSIQAFFHVRRGRYEFAVSTSRQHFDPRVIETTS